MQLPEIVPLKNSDININHVFFKTREALIQIMISNVSETILGIEYEESLMASYMIPGFCVNLCQHLNIC